MARRTGTLLVTNDDVTGQIVFDDGRIVHAVYGNLTGNQAFFRFVCASDGHFEFDPSPLALGAHERTITESAMSLILEGARLSDVARRGKGIAAGRAAQSPLSLPAPRSSGSFKPRGSRAPAAAIVASVASQYEAAIRDNFTLGDLKMLTERDLAEWTEWDGGRDRFHVVLMASLAEAVSGILPLAAAPSERFVLGGLDPAKKALALAFHRRDERLLDLVLLDVRDAGGLAVALRRTPSAIVIAPPGGNFMALGTQARASLQDVLMDLAAPVVVGVGHPSLPASLAEIGIVPSPGRAVSSAPGLLCDPAFDLRGLLGNAIRLFSTARGGSTEKRPA